jgi:hypothetical protein
LIDYLKSAGRPDIILLKSFADLCCGFWLLSIPRWRAHSNMHSAVDATFLLWSALNQLCNQELRQVESFFQVMFFGTKLCSRAVTIYGSHTTQDAIIWTKHQMIFDRQFVRTIHCCEHNISLFQKSITCVCSQAMSWL